METGTSANKATTTWWNLDRTGTLAGLGLIIVLACWIAWIEKAYVEFDPVNGHWQNFNSQARLLAGQHPFLDFPAYLGLAPLYLPFPLFVALGGTLGASNAAFDFICVLAMGCSMALLLRLCSMRPCLAWCLAALATSLPWPMERGNDSALGIRSALPFVAAGALLALMRWQNIARNRHQLLLIDMVAGSLCGLMPLWSNDYGIPTAASFLVVYLLSKDTRIPGTLAFLCLGILSFMAALGMATHGNPETWFKFNFGGVLADQFWFYNPVALGKVYSLKDIPHGTATIIMVLPNIAMTSLWLWNRKNPGLAALAVVCTAGVGGAFVSGLAGTFQFRYFMPLWRISIVTLPACLIFAFRHILPGFSQLLFTRVFKSNQVTAILATYSLMLATYIFWTNAREVYWHLPGPNDVEVAELGTSVPPSYVPAIETGRKLAKQYQDLNIPRSRRLLSTYATATAYLANSRQTVPDYIIHALGQDMRDGFVAALDQGYQNVETIDPSLLLWGAWNVRASWPFYRKLYTEWQPVMTTPWSLIWSRRNSALPPGPLLDCKVETHDNSGFTTLRVDTSGLGEPWTVEVVANARMQFTAEPIPILGTHKLLEVIADYNGHERNVDQDSSPAQVASVVADTWTLPLQNGPVAMPLLAQPGSTATLSLRAWPRDRARIAVSECTARGIAPISSTSMARPSLSRQPIVVDLAPGNGLPPAVEPYPGQDIEQVYLRTLDPLTATRIPVGSLVEFSDGTKGRVLLHDFWHINVEWPKGAPRPRNEIKQVKIVLDH